MRKIISLILCTVISLCFPSYASENEAQTIDDIIADAASYIYETVEAPYPGSVGGEWAVFGLARSGYDVPAEYYESYYTKVEEYVSERSGKLHDKKYTEYSRLIIALTAIGKDPRNTAGYNLLTPLGDFEKTVWQGINGAAWALIALDCGNYEIPELAATREMYVNHILKSRTSDGGWAMSGDIADPDVTGMVIQALSKYQDNEAVREATETALLRMSEIQRENGGFSESVESSVQMSVALCELGISLNDGRFVKNGNTITDSILECYSKGKGFRHSADEESSNQMATEQCLYALAAIKRAEESKNSLYRMSDVTRESIEQAEDVGLTGKNADVMATDVIYQGKTFSDVDGHKYRTAIEVLASRGIINGKTEERFEPDSTMTRAEYAAITARGLGLPLKSISVFGDVTENEWFYGYVGTAYSCGIIKGVSEEEFNPDGTITREEVAVMTERAAKLCGIDTAVDTFEARNILAEFVDYVKASDWAVSSLAFCCKEGIISEASMEIKPKEAVTRAEIAEMLYNMLKAARLLQE